jgi:hypothetical protein
MSSHNGQGIGENCPNAHAGEEGGRGKGMGRGKRYFMIERKRTRYEDRIIVG